MIKKVKLMNVARLMTIALCSMLIFIACGKDSITEDPPIDGVTMEQYVQETVLSYVPDEKVISSKLTTAAGKINQKIHTDKY